MLRPIVRECSQVHIPAAEGDQLLSLGNSYPQRYQAREPSDLIGDQLAQAVRFRLCQKPPSAEGESEYDRLCRHQVVQVPRAVAWRQILQGSGHMGHWVHYGGADRRRASISWRIRDRLALRYSKNTWLHDSRAVREIPKESTFRRLQVSGPLKTGDPREALCRQTVKAGAISNGRSLSYGS